MDGCQCFLLSYRAAWIFYHTVLTAQELFFFTALSAIGTARVETLSYFHFTDPLLFSCLCFVVNSCYFFHAYQLI